MLRMWRAAGQECQRYPNRLLKNEKLRRVLAAARAFGLFVEKSYSTKVYKKLVDWCVVGSAQEATLFSPSPNLRFACFGPCS